MNKQTTNSAGQNFRTSIFWAMELEINTDSRRKDIASNPSDAEVILDALIEHQRKLFDELEKQRDAWVSGRKAPMCDLLDSFATGELARTIEQIKVCNTYIGLMANNLAADLRKIGNSIKTDSTNHE
ncbi:hypothetical protein GCM10028808_74930 [Spirosoma migulaei]